MYNLTEMLFDTRVKQKKIKSYCSVMNLNIKVKTKKGSVFEHMHTCLVVRLTKLTLSVQLKSWKLLGNT